jgi:hypothetical protein
MKITNIYTLLLSLLLFGLASCAVTDMDRSADFSKYQTFAWGESEIDVSNPVYDSDLISKRIRTTVEKEFAKRGIVKNENNPDFIVSYHTYTEEKQRAYDGYPYGSYGYPYYPFRFYPFAFGWGYPYHWMRPTTTKEYTEGTLVLDIIDRKSDHLVWRGSVSGDVENLSALKKQIEKGIKAIMKKYPVTPDTPLNIGNDAKIIS